MHERRNDKFYHLGCPIWANKDWVGSLFTRKAKPKDYLRQYSSVFSTVECNSTFYADPSIDQLRRWRTETPSDFKFSFKLPRSITHVAKLRHVQKAMSDFLTRMEVIEDRLGTYFIQLPPSFNTKYFSALEKFLAILPESLAFALEVRHIDFFIEQHHEARLNALLARYAIDRAIFDTQVLHSIPEEEADVDILAAQSRKPNMPRCFTATARQPFLRYCGYKTVQNNEAALYPIVEQTYNWIAEGKTPYIFLHSPGDEFAPHIAKRFHELLEEKNKGKDKVLQLEALPDWPGSREQNMPKQGSLF